MQERKIITKLPAQWPLKGFSRVDCGETIVLMHHDRTPMASEDGKTWRDIDLRNREDNQIMFQIEKRKIVR